MPPPSLTVALPLARLLHRQTCVRLPADSEEEGLATKARRQGEGPRKVRRGPLTRKQILDTSLRLFSEKGFARTSVRDIARGAGITDAAIYYHFSSNRYLFEALFEERGIPLALSELEQATITLPPLETVSAIAVVALDIMGRNKDFMKVLLSEAMGEDAIAIEDYRMVTERWRNAVARIVREYVQRGDLPPVDVEVVARQIVVLSVGPFMDELMFGEDRDGDQPSPGLVLRVRTAVAHFA